MNRGNGEKRLQVTRRILAVMALGTASAAGIMALLRMETPEQIITVLALMYGVAQTITSSYFIDKAKGGGGV